MQPVNQKAIAYALTLLLVLFSIGAEAQNPHRRLALINPEGLAIIPVMEGWVGNEDGTASISFGYVNRNAEPVEIPLGANNNISPAQLDGMQPTHFAAGRHTGVFTVTLPADMRDVDAWWSIKTFDHEPNKVPGRVGAAAYELDFIRPRPQGSLQPLAWYEDEREKSAGLFALLDDYTGQARVGEPVTLAVNVEDPSERDPADPRFVEALPLGVHWYKHQGPGRVEFTRHDSTPAIEASDEDPRFRRFRGGIDPDDQSAVEVVGGRGTAKVVATFSEPGEYILRTKIENFRAPDSSNGDQCCWTNIFQRIQVGY